MKDLPQLLDQREACAYLGVSQPTLNRWRCQGQGPKFVKMGRVIRYRAADVAAFVEQSLRAHT